MESASLGQEAACAAGAPPELRGRLIACEPGDPLRERVERFVRDAFFRVHRARIRTFMPTLLALADAGGEICAAVGCRSAAREPLFLEQYLDAPIERIIAARVGGHTPRAAIVELGNFASRNSHIAGALIARLPRFLIGQRYLWLAFTATRAVRRILRHRGAHPMDLGAASLDRVAAHADDWGCYYESDPHVMAGYLPLARALPDLWRAPDAD